MTAFNLVCKIHDTCYVVFADKTDKNVGVCVDEYGDTANAGYTLEDIKEYCEAYPEMVFTEYEDAESIRGRQITYLNNLEGWFDSYFTMQMQQHLWQEDYIPSHDDFFNCNYINWEELCAKANEVRAEIKERRSSL